MECLTRGMYRFPAKERSENRTNQFFATGLQQTNEHRNPEDWMSGYAVSGRGENRESRFREDVMRWIEQQATETWAPAEEGTRALAAFDFLTVSIKPVPAPVPSYPETAGEVELRTRWTQTGQPSSSIDAGQRLGPGRGHGRYTGGLPTSLNEEVSRQR